jgi:uncharacterized membrane protein YfcA
MDMDLPQLAFLAGILLASGLAAGLIAGLLGVGGGIVVVPVLHVVLTATGMAPESTMHVAVGTSLATIIPTAISSSRAHWKKDAVDLDLLKAWGPAVAVGVMIGAALGGRLTSGALTLIFAVVALLVAANMVFRRDAAPLTDRLPGAPLKHVLGMVVGLFSVLMGIGGGTLSVPILTACSFPIRRAVGTASAIGLIIAVFGATGYVISGWGVPDRPPFSLGYVNLAGFGLIIPASILTAPLGARIAHAIDPQHLKSFFAFFLVLVSAKMFWSVFS